MLMLEKSPHETRADPKVAASGLEGIVVAETKLSHVDGERGRLIIAGHDVETLARSSFEVACSTVLASASEAVPPDMHAALAGARVRAFDYLASAEKAFLHESAMDALRTAMSALPENTPSIDLIGAAPVFVAAYARYRSNKPVIAPNPALSHAADFLAMLGLPHDEVRARGLDAYLVTVCDHGLNASTFTARVIASTESDRVSAIVGAIGALKGPLHGGAPGPVLDMLDAIGSAENATSYLENALLRKERIMGMGHRIYRVRDPRALVFEAAIEALEQSLDAAGDSHNRAVRARLKLAREVEAEAERLLAVKHPSRPLRANVEFYTAVLLEALGVPRDLFSAVFAAGRVLGWCAHYAEQRNTGRLIRPSSRYIGAIP